MIIKTYSQLQRIMLLNILPKLMEHLSRKVEEILKIKLNLADISTSTLQDYVTHEMVQKGNTWTSIIYIDDDGAQEETEGTMEWGRLRKFISLDGSTSYDGKSIVWNMINWLENTGASGSIGNNPIRPISMFEATVKEVETNLSRWVKEFLKKYGLS